MERQEVFDKVKSIVAVYSKNEENLANATESTTFLEDLAINSARLVDIVLEMEDAFDIEIDDDSADEIISMGDAVNLIVEKISA